MPLSELTYDRRGPASSAAVISAAMSAPPSRLASPVRIEPRPLSGVSPAAVSFSPWVAKTSRRKALTTWPKMIGSLTFIIVAFRCTE